MTDDEEILRFFASIKEVGISTSHCQYAIVRKLRERDYVRRFFGTLHEITEEGRAVLAEMEGA